MCHVHHFHSAMSDHLMQPRLKDLFVREAANVLK